MAANSTVREVHLTTHPYGLDLIDDVSGPFTSQEDQIDLSDFPEVALAVGRTLGEAVSQGMQSVSSWLFGEDDEWLPPKPLSHRARTHASGCRVDAVDCSDVYDCVDGDAGCSCEDDESPRSMHHMASMSAGSTPRASACGSPWATSSCEEWAGRSGWGCRSHRISGDIMPEVEDGLRGMHARLVGVATDAVKAAEAVAMKKRE